MAISLISRDNTIDDLWNSIKRKKSLAPGRKVSELPFGYIYSQTRLNGVQILHRFQNRRRFLLICIFGFSLRRKTLDRKNSSIHVTVWYEKEFGLSWVSEITSCRSFPSSREAYFGVVLPASLSWFLSYMDTFHHKEARISLRNKMKLDMAITWFHWPREDWSTSHWEVGLVGTVQVRSRVIRETY